MRFSRLALISFVACGPSVAFGANGRFAINFPVSPKTASTATGPVKYLVSPTGKVAFRYNLISKEEGPSGVKSGDQPVDDGSLPPRGSVVYTIKVKAVGPNGQEVSSSVTKTLYGQAQTMVEIPLNVDWAENVITSEVLSYESHCPSQHFVTKLNGWEPSCTSTPLKTVGDSFLLLVTPAAAFQLPVVPVGIVYGPLGNQGKSSFAVTLNTAKNQSIGTSKAQTYSYTNDDKTNYTAGITVGISGSSVGKINGGFNINGSWDQSTESSYGETYGTTGSIASENQMGTTFSVGPLKTPVWQISYTTQPFWQDVILVSINAQYALWAYPAGPVVQPLASADVAELPVMQLDHCAKTQRASAPSSLNPVSWKSNHAFSLGTMLLSEDLNHIYVATKGGISGAKAPSWNTEEGAKTADGTVVWTNEQDHFIPYAGSVESGVTKYIWLSSADCSNLASLDPFYANKTQSSHPKAYRVIGGGTSLQLDAGTTFQNSDKTTQTVGESNSSQLASKVTSAAVNSQDDSIGVDILSMIGINYKETNSSGTTVVATTTDSQTLQKSQTIAGTATESTTIQDSCSGTVPVNVVQDMIFSGIAVQDTNMHFLPSEPKPSPTTQPCPSAAPAVTAKAEFTQTVSGEAFNPDKLVPEIALPNLPVVPAAASRALLRKTGSPEPETYVRRTNYGYVIVKRPSASEAALIKDALRAVHVEALKTHVTRTIPPAN
jgi:hypothetical protein